MRTRLPGGFRQDVDVVAVGASAGGIDALFTLFAGLPAGFAGRAIVVLHLPQDHESRLPEVFQNRLGIPVEEARSLAPVRPGTLHFAPSGYHLLVESDGTFSLSCDPPVLFSRPSIDVLMESVADAWGARSAGIILTGANEDGARGLARIRAAGGLAAVQDPAEAQHAAMPEAAVRLAGPDFVLPLQELRRLVHTLLCP